MNHERIITCSCGETFTDEDDFKIHQETERREEFVEKAQEWFESNLGEPFASWHQECQSMGGIDAYHETQHGDIPEEPTDENVRAACLSWARSALVEGNAEELLSMTPSDDYDEHSVSYEEIDALINEIETVIEGRHNMVMSRIGDGTYSIGRGDGYGLEIEVKYH